jgi:phospholipase C
MLSILSERPFSSAVGAGAACFLLASCGGRGITTVVPPTGGQLSLRAHLAATNPIQHVVIIIQENRSVDNLFHGYPGATTVNSGKDHLGHTITLQPISLAASFDLVHRFTQAVRSIDYPKGEAMDGFDTQLCNGSCPQNAAYTFVNKAEVQTYWNIAQQYVLADHFFASDLDTSFQGHQFLIAGQAEKTWGIPTNRGAWGCDGGSNDTVQLLDTSTMPGTTTTRTLPACFDSPNTPFDTTLADELDAKQISWKYYAPASGAPGYIWSAYDAVKHIRNGPDWTANVIAPPSRFISDVGAGKLAGVTWIVPDVVNSDHPGNQSTTGPRWVASLIDAVGNSAFWRTSAIFVLWDDWGGMYDSVPPPLLDYDGLGIRVPLLAVSPYALQGSVTKTTYEFGSVLKFTENTFGLAALAASDSRAANFGGDVFNFSQSPRPFSPFAKPRDRAFFLHQAPSNRAPDDN